MRPMLLNGAHRQQSDVHLLNALPGFQPGKLPPEMTLLMQSVGNLFGIETLLLIIRLKGERLIQTRVFEGIKTRPFFPDAVHSPVCILHENP